MCVWHVKNVRHVRGGNVAAIEQPLHFGVFCLPPSSTWSSLCIDNVVATASCCCYCCCLRRGHEYLMKLAQVACNALRFGVSCAACSMPANESRLRHVFVCV